MKRLKDFIWPAIGVAAVIWAARLLYHKLYAEVASDAGVAARLEAGSLLADLGIIFGVLGQKIAAIPAHALGLSLASAALAYVALGWYDKLALMHLRRDKGSASPTSAPPPS